MNSRRAVALAAVLLILVAGVGLLYVARAQIPPAAVVPSASTPTPTSSPAPTATAAGTPRVEASSIVLDLAVGPEYEQPAATTPGVGGLTSRGPTSVAVDRDGRIYLWDQARVRILVYEGGRLAKVLPEPFVEQNSTSLLAHGGRLYLRWAPDRPFAEYEIDAGSGDLVRLGTGLYPRERVPLTSFESKGPQPPMGVDALGNTYQRSSIANGYEVRRVDRSGVTVAIGTSATTDLVLDSYVAGDGSVYDLRQSFNGGLAERIRVVRLLGSAGAIPPETAPPITAAPRFAGRDAPSSIEVLSARELPPAMLTGADARSFWWLLSYSRTDPFFDTLPAPGEEAYRLKANWADGSTLSIAMNSNLTVAGTARFGTSPLAERALPNFLLRPAFVIDALRRYGATVRIPDVTNVGRALTGAELDQLIAALGSAFPTTFFERYQPLEDPFPRRQLTVGYPGGSLVLQDVGDRYFRTAALHRGAMVHDGRVATLMRSWLPTPTFARDDPAILYTAEKVTLPDQDISRWKTSIVRALLLGPSSPGQGTYDAQGPLVFTFTLPGVRTEVVRVDAKGFTFAGKTYERTGLLDLHGLKGVP